MLPVLPFSFHSQFSTLFSVRLFTLCLTCLYVISFFSLLLPSFSLSQSSCDISLTAWWPPSSGALCNYKTWLIYLDSVGVVHPGAWWIWCSLSLPAPFSLIVHSFSLPCTATFPSQGQPFSVMYNINYSSPFPLWRDNKINCLQKGAQFFLVYSNYPVCLPINTSDQSSLGSRQSWKEESKGIKELERTEREVVVGWGGCRKWEKKAGKRHAGVER